METVKDIILSHLKVVQAGMAMNMTRLHRSASGRSVASLEVEVTEGENVTGTILGSPNWAVMQQGRGPGGVPRDFTSVIKDWIVRKGISYSGVGSPKASPETRLNSLSYLIARSIMQKGTKLYRDKGYNDIYDSLVEEEVEKMSDETMGLFEMKVDEINDKNDAED